MERVEAIGDNSPCMNAGASQATLHHVVRYRLKAVPQPGVFVAFTRAACYRLTDVSNGTLNIGYVPAFTQGNDLPWNAQTVVGCQCTSEQMYYITLTSTCQIVMIGTMEKKRKSTMLRLSEQDLQAVLKIRAYYGIASDNQAIILAINLTARQIETPAGGGVSPPWLKPGALTPLIG